HDAGPQEPVGRGEGEGGDEQRALVADERAAQAPDQRHEERPAEEPRDDAGAAVAQRERAAPHREREVRELVAHEVEPVRERRAYGRRHERRQHRQREHDGAARRDDGPGGEAEGGERAHRGNLRADPLRSFNGGLWNPPKVGAVKGWHSRSESARLASSPPTPSTRPFRGPPWQSRSSRLPTASSSGPRRPRRRRPAASTSRTPPRRSRSAAPSSPSARARSRTGPTSRCPSRRATPSSTGSTPAPRSASATTTCSSCASPTSSAS